jgi:type VI secretion system secreted protein VgrG
VLVHFLEGDPDRPVVLGRVYNGEDTFPASLPENKTQSALKSLSSPTRDGTNEIQLEDAAGKERLLVHAERDQNIVVANDKRQQVLSNEQSVIGRNEAVAIGANHTAVVGNHHTGTVGKDQTLTVAGKRSRSVSSNETSAVEGNRKLQISGMHFRRVGTDDIVKAKNFGEQVGAVILETHLKTNTTNAGKAMTLTVGGAMIELARKEKVENVEGVRAETIGGSVMTKAKGAFKIGVKTSRKTTVGGALTVEAKKKLVVRAQDQVSGKAATATLDGSTSVTLKVGESIVLLSEGVLKLHASSTITFKITGPNDEGASKSDQN